MGASQMSDWRITFLGAAVRRLCRNGVTSVEKQEYRHARRNESNACERPRRCRHQGAQHQAAADDEECRWHEGISGNAVGPDTRTFGLTLSKDF